MFFDPICNVLYFSNLNFNFQISSQNDNLVISNDNGLKSSLTSSANSSISDFILLDKSFITIKNNIRPSTDS